MKQKYNIAFMYGLLIGGYLIHKLSTPTVEKPPEQPRWCEYARYESDKEYTESEKPSVGYVIMQGESYIVQVPCDTIK